MSEALRANLRSPAVLVFPPGLAAVLRERPGAELFPRNGMVAYESDVRVLRPGKF